VTLSAMGIIHTIAGIIALGCAIHQFYTRKQISSDNLSGKIYLLTTLLTAVSALTIFRHGGPNAAHGLAVLTVLAITAGWIVEHFSILKNYTRYFVALCFSGSFLFHMLPTATEILTRFPVEAPLVNSLTDPLLQKTFLAITVVYVVMFSLQIRHLYSEHHSSQT